MIVKTAFEGLLPPFRQTFKKKFIFELLQQEILQSTYFVAEDGFNCRLSCAYKGTSFCYVLVKGICCVI